MRVQGKIKWFSTQKGYGFVTVDGGKDVFIHGSNVESGGVLRLKEGMAVDFVVARGTKGPQAEDLKILAS